MQLLAGCHTSTISVTTFRLTAFHVNYSIYIYIYIYMFQSHVTYMYFTVSTGKTPCALPVSADSLPGKPGAKWYITENVQHTHTAPCLQVKNWHVPVRQSSECSKTEVHVCHWVCIRYALPLAGRHLSGIGNFQSVSQKKMKRLMKAGCTVWTLGQCHVTRSNTVKPF
jgi:hypothetical protein